MHNTRHCEEPEATKQSRRHGVSPGPRLLPRGSSPRVAMTAYYSSEVDSDEAEIDRHRRGRRDHEARRHPGHVADPVACRRGTQRNGRCRAQTRRHRRHRDGRRDAGDGRALPGPHAEMGRRDRSRRLLVHDPCPPRRRGDRLGPVRDGADHAWRERPLRRRAHPQCRRADEPRRPVRAALWADGAADFVHDPGVALHEDLWADARAIGDGLGRAARMVGAKTRAPPSGRRSRSRMC